MRVLYVSYYFPPVGGAGVQRTLKFVRYLPEHGVVPVVLTGPGVGAGRWAPEDETLAAEIPGDVEVVRARGPEPSPAGGWRARGSRWLRIPSSWAEWWREQIVETGGALRADVLLCSMSPFESAVAAAELAAKLGIPWVADLRDPWALDEMMSWPTELHRTLERRAMRRTLASAAVIVMNTREATERLRTAFPEFRRKRVVTIPNGFDRDDFAGPEPIRDDEAFRIVHTGYLHTELGLAHRRRSWLRRALGGSARSVDFLTRSHVVLIEALDRVVSASVPTSRPVELWFAGVMSEEDRRQLRGRRYVRSLGYASHAESIQLMRSADLLFLPMQNLPPPQRATIVPGKAYEYLASGRPVLGAVPDGDARDLLEKAAATTVCRPDDAAAIAAAISRLAARGRVASVARGELLRFERRELTRELAAALRSALELASAGNARP